MKRSARHTAHEGQWYTERPETLNDAEEDA